MRTEQAMGLALPALVTAQVVFQTWTVRRRRRRRVVVPAILLEMDSTSCGVACGLYQARDILSFGIKIVFQCKISIYALERNRMTAWF